MENKINEVVEHLIMRSDNFKKDLSRASLEANDYIREHFKGLTDTEFKTLYETSLKEFLVLYIESFNLASGKVIELQNYIQNNDVNLSLDYVESELK